MTNDLVKRLRDLGDHASFEPHMHHTAADRIEELERRNLNLVAVAGDRMNLRTELTVEKAKLAKALDALEGVRVFVRDLEPYADQGHTLVPALHKACTILAELTKGQDDE